MTIIILLITLLTVTSVNATDVMANTTVDDYVVHESTKNPSHSESEISESTREETVREDVLKTTNSNSDTTNKQQSTNALKTGDNENNVLSESSRTVVVNNYEGLLDLFKNVTSYGITEENLIINLSGDDDYKITKVLNLRNTFSSVSKLKNLTINGNNKVIDGCGLNGFLELSSGDVPLSLTLNNVIVKNCSKSGLGGAICIDSNTRSNVTIVDSVFENNVVGPNFSGGAIYFKGDSLKIISSNFTSNTAFNLGGAIYIGTGSNLTLIGSNLTNNNVNNDGGAIFITGDGTTANITNNMFEDNFVKTDKQYVISLSNNAKVIIDNNLFVNNTDVTRDMLFGGNGIFDVKDNNVYIDNYLEDSWDSSIPSTIVMVPDREFDPIHFVNLHKIYNNVIVNGTLNFYHNKDDEKPFATFEIINGNATLKFSESDLDLGLNTVWYDYTSLSKHYQNLTDKHQLEIVLQPSLVTITVNKKWYYTEYGPVEVNIINRDTGKIVGTLNLSNENGWENSTDLPKDDNGVLINYTVKEVGVSDSYKSYVSNTSAYNFTLTNVELDSLIVKIDWNDNNDEDGLRPNSVTVTVSNADTGEELDKFDLTKSSNWEHTFDKLPKYDSRGKLIKYAVNNTIPGYTTDVITMPNKVILNNTHIPEKINLNVNVVWLNKGLHPNSAKLQLYANGKPMGEPVSTINDKYVFNLPKYSKGKPIDYTVDLLNLPNGCTEKTTKNGYNITITVKNSVKKIFKWGIKLILIQPKEDPNKHNKKHSSTKKINHISKRYKQTNYAKGKHHRNHNYPVNTYKYRLYVSLYKEYMSGNITYDDFVAILEANNIKVTRDDWDDNGVISIEYDDMDDVPDTVTLHNKKGNIPDSKVKIDKTKTKNNKVVDSKEVKVEYDEQ